MFILEIRINASIQCIINMIREAAQNTIFHLKDIKNENNKIVYRNNKKLIEALKNMGRDA